MGFRHRRRIGKSKINGPKMQVLRVKLCVYRVIGLRVSFEVCHVLFFSYTTKYGGSTLKSILRTTLTD